MSKKAKKQVTKTQVEKVLSPVDDMKTKLSKLEQFLIENNLVIGVQAIHSQMWRKKILTIVLKVLGVEVAPYLYPVLKK